MTARTIAATRPALSSIWTTVASSKCRWWSLCLKRVLAVIEPPYYVVFLHHHSTMLQLLPFLHSFSSLFLCLSLTVKEEKCQLTTRAIYYTFSLSLEWDQTVLSFFLVRLFHLYTLTLRFLLQQLMSLRFLPLPSMIPTLMRWKYKYFKVVQNYSLTSRWEKNRRFSF